MIKIANCPRCKIVPVVGRHSGFIFCCGVKVDAIDLEKSAKIWNEYAAAMELAFSIVALDKSDPRLEHQWQFHVTESINNVLQVFEGKGA